MGCATYSLQVTLLGEEGPGLGGPTRADKKGGSALPTIQISLSLSFLRLRSAVFGFGLCLSNGCHRTHHSCLSPPLLHLFAIPPAASGFPMSPEVALPQTLLHGAAAVGRRQRAGSPREMPPEGSPHCSGSDAVSALRPTTIGGAGGGGRLLPPARSFQSLVRCLQGQPQGHSRPSCG